MNFNSGAGYPHQLRCAKCRIGASAPRRGRNIVATGRKKPNLGKVGIRQWIFFVEYNCLDCKHRGWTKHIDGRRLLARREEELRGEIQE